MRGVVWTNFTQSHTQILLYAPPGVGITNTLQVLVAGVSGNIQNLVYFAPIINSISPSNGATSGESAAPLVCCLPAKWRSCIEPVLCGA